MDLSSKYDPSKEGHSLSICKRQGCEVSGLHNNNYEDYVSLLRFDDVNFGKELLQNVGPVYQRNGITSEKTVTLKGGAGSETGQDFVQR
jgi:hypothetical protein